MKLNIWRRFSAYVLMAMYYGIAWLVARHWQVKIEHALLGVLLYANCRTQMEFYFIRQQISSPPSQPQETSHDRVRSQASPIDQKQSPRLNRSGISRLT